VDFAQDFFGREAFLTVSGHLNVEAYCLALTKVYTFRGSWVKTKRARSRRCVRLAANSAIPKSPSMRFRCTIGARFMFD
jgi:hypothetical protein